MKRGFPDKTTTSVLISYEDGSSYEVRRATRLEVFNSRVEIDYDAVIATGISETRTLKLDKTAGVEFIDVEEPLHKRDTSLRFHEGKFTSRTVDQVGIWASAREDITIVKFSPTLEVTVVMDGNPVNPVNAHKIAADKLWSKVIEDCKLPRSN